MSVSLTQVKLLQCSEKVKAAAQTSQSHTSFQLDLLLLGNEAEASSVCVS